MSKDSCILVTGGAGYIGSHTVHLLAAQGQRLVVLDNLVYGHREAIIDEGVELIVGEVGDKALIEGIFTRYEVEAVIHFAAYAFVGESVEHPSKYYHNNTADPLVLLDAMRDHGCKKFIFSSTCATYGNPEYMPLDEKHAQNPISPYGQSKLMLEKILIDYDKAYGIRNVRLRYFNACGASEDGSIGEDHTPETHLIPLVIEAIQGQRDHITVFGTDYDTPDGTCIRDYIHVLDLGRAHIKALGYLRDGGDSVACNLGTGNGVSVKQILDVAAEVSGKNVPTEYGERRAGDPPQLVAAPQLAKDVLGWEAEYKDVRSVIESAWRWATGPKKGRYES